MPTCAGLRVASNHFFLVLEVYIYADIQKGLSCKIDPNTYRVYYLMVAPPTVQPHSLPPCPPPLRLSPPTLSYTPPATPFRTQNFLSYTNALDQASGTTLRISLHLVRVKLQYTAVHCSTLQHTATHCNTRQHTATHGSTRQHTATHGRQHTATHGNTRQHTDRLSLLRMHHVPMT